MVCTPLSYLAPSTLLHGTQYFPYWIAFVAVCSSSLHPQQVTIVLSFLNGSVSSDHKPARVCELYRDQLRLMLLFRILRRRRARPWPPPSNLHIINHTYVFPAGLEESTVLHKPFAVLPMLPQPNPARRNHEMRLPAAPPLVQVYTFPRMPTRVAVPRRSSATGNRSS